MKVAKWKQIKQLIIINGEMKATQYIWWNNNSRGTTNEADDVNKN